MDTWLFFLRSVICGIRPLPLLRVTAIDGTIFPDHASINDHDHKVYTMLKTLWAIIREGKIELSEHVNLPEDTRVLVTLLPDDETDLWLRASQISLDSIWDNAEDDVYAQLLKE